MRLFESSQLPHALSIPPCTRWWGVWGRRKEAASLGEALRRWPEQGGRHQCGAGPPHPSCVTLHKLLLPQCLHFLVCPTAPTPQGWENQRLLAQCLTRSRHDSKSGHPLIFTRALTFPCEAHGNRQDVSSLNVSPPADSGLCSKALSVTAPGGCD